MTLAGSYLWLKGFHIAAALLFIGGTLAVSLVTARPVEERVSRTLLNRLRRWDRFVTTPAMLLVWTLGLTLAQIGHRFPEGWLLAKLAVVVAVSALHGVVSGRLRRLASGEELPTFRVAPFVVACAIAIAVLASVKPF